MNFQPSRIVSPDARVTDALAPDAVATDPHAGAPRAAEPGVTPRQARPVRRRRAPAARGSSGTVVAGTVVGGAVAALAVSALVNHRLALKAERDNPPAGRFLRVGGVRLHCVERGSGAPLVLLHGNGSMIQDFESSGLIDLAARTHRVIAFDRPGYGHSERPRSRVWTPEAQADLIREALARLGVERATVLGHSWGCLVALALARKYPGLVSGLVLASGYYYPTARVDVLAMGAPSVPVVGDVLRYTLAPVVSRLVWPRLMRRIFGPRRVPAKFAAGFPKEMAVRPSQLRASATESALMVPEAVAAQGTYGSLGMPVAIVAGAEDRLIDVRAQSGRLHRDIPGSSLHVVRRVGHMVHQSAPAAVMAAVERVGPRETPEAG